MLTGLNLLRCSSSAVFGRSYRRHAIFADPSAVAPCIIWVSCQISLARVVWDSVIGCELINLSWVTAIARTSSVAVHDYLRGEFPTYSVLDKDIGSVCKCRSGALSPA